MLSDFPFTFPLAGTYKWCAAGALFGRQWMRMPAGGWAVERRANVSPQQGVCSFCGENVPRDALIYGQNRVGICSACALAAQRSYRGGPSSLERHLIVASPSARCSFCGRRQSFLICSRRVDRQYSILRSKDLVPCVCNDCARSLQTSRSSWPAAGRGQRQRS